jgi:hypothetical protein
MFLSFRKSATLAVAAVALGAVPQTAWAAGESKATGTSALQVNNQCAITGANVDLGTYFTSNTWATVANRLGYDADGVTPDTSYHPGALGFEYLDFGSVNCSVKVGYTLQIGGTGSRGTVQMPMNGKVGSFWVALKSIGGSVLTDSDNSSFGGAGVVMVLPAAAAKGTGTGAEERLKGSVILLAYSSISLTDKLTAGRYTDTLNYAITF